MAFRSSRVFPRFAGPLVILGSHGLRRRLRVVRRRLSTPSGVWRRALPRELGYWSLYVETGGLSHPQEFRARLDPSAPIVDPYLLAAIDSVGAQHVRILDVGAGPMTTVGHVDNRGAVRNIEVVAVDPLAAEYGALLRAAGVRPPVSTQPCRGEDVALQFGCSTFDIAYARNSLDHSADPLAAISAMVDVVRPGGQVVLVHGRCEAEARDYEELHQWNFDVRDGCFVVFNKRYSFDITARFRTRVDITTDTFDAGEHGAWVVATLARLDDRSGLKPSHRSPDTSRSVGRRQ